MKMTIFVFFGLFSLAFAGMHSPSDNVDLANTQQCGTQGCAKGTDNTALLMTKINVSKMTQQVDLTQRQHTELVKADLKDCSCNSEGAFCTSEDSVDKDWCYLAEGRASSQCRTLTGTVVDWSWSYCVWNGNRQLDCHKVCADDPDWVDNKFGGSGKSTCNGGELGGIASNPHWCTDYGDYSIEARRACPVACGTCLMVSKDSQACPSDCRESKCREGSASNGGLPLTNGVCTSFCSKEYTEYSGFRFCGQGSEYVDGSHIDCTICGGGQVLLPMCSCRRPVQYFEGKAWCWLTKDDRFGSRCIASDGTKKCWAWAYCDTVACPGN